MTLFDPVTGKLIDPEVLASLQFAGATTREVTKTVDGVEFRTTLDDRGSIGTIHQHVLGTERVDAHAFIAKPVSIAPDPLKAGLQ